VMIADNDRASPGGKMNRLRSPGVEGNILQR
jgi:hypothetical protein